ncbi:MAG: hypothetical protein NTX50_07400 [Candidatus Sumerlaeota bacterium]|nr:hypothetical protein [Candidatus Sumerlaeota bacterium]
MGRLNYGKGLSIDVPWITAKGNIDFTKYPIDDVLTQTLSDNDQMLNSGCNILQSMALGGRTEAMIYLLGLGRWYAEDLRKLAVVVTRLGQCRCAVSAAFLLDELRRVKSTNTTRVYLGEVLKALSRFSYEIVGESLERLSLDTHFSYKMRNKLQDLAEELQFRSMRRAQRLAEIEEQSSMSS